MKKPNKRFEAVSLSFNIGSPTSVSDNLNPLLDCNPGGSVICTVGTDCSSGGTCVGTSCSGNSATKDLSLDAHILVDKDQLENLRNQLQKVLTKFVG